MTDSGEPIEARLRSSCARSAFADLAHYDGPCGSCLRCKAADAIANARRSLTPSAEMAAELRNLCDEVENIHTATTGEVGLIHSTEVRAILAKYEQASKEAGE